MKKLLYIRLGVYPFIYNFCEIFQKFFCNFRINFIEFLEDKILQKCQISFTKFLKIVLGTQNNFVNCGHHFQFLLINFDILFQMNDKLRANLCVNYELVERQMQFQRTTRTKCAFIVRSDPRPFYELSKMKKIKCRNLRSCFMENS